MSGESIRMNIFLLTPIGSLRALILTSLVRTTVQLFYSEA
jgi:hypothetical protein